MNGSYVFYLFLKKTVQIETPFIYNGGKYSIARVALIFLQLKHMSIYRITRSCIIPKKISITAFDTAYKYYLIQHLVV